MAGRTVTAGAAAVTALALAGCGGGDDTLTIYSGREEELVAPLIEQFEQETGIDAEVRYGDSAELAATIAEEGDGSPADVFFAQDPGSLGAVAREGLLAELPTESLARVPERFRDPDGRWVGTSGRSRVIAYNTDALSEDEVPDSVFDLTDARWRGKVGVAPTNASFQAFVTAMRLQHGEDATREWLEAMKENGVRFYEKNTPIVEAVASGEIEFGLVNHYYLYLVQEEQPDAAVANHFLAGDDPGALVSAAGVAVLEEADSRDEAERFVEYLLSDQGQRFYTEGAEEAEYPLVSGIPAKEGLPPLASLGGPELDYASLGDELERTLELLNETGYTS
ncbi:MAG TPA: iron ABC transporter substrate-binding protein [Gaiellaceae bacterium]|nr:iron ABC transporter substrate-binding protein [Gaiellaceae bacterium]